MRFTVGRVAQPPLYSIQTFVFVCFVFCFVFGMRTVLPDSAVQPDEAYDGSFHLQVQSAVAAGSDSIDKVVGNLPTKIDEDGIVKKIKAPWESDKVRGSIYVEICRERKANNRFSSRISEISHGNFSFICSILRDIDMYYVLYRLPSLLL